MKYKAFISYRHRSPDKEIVVKLQKMLESYRPPKTITKEKQSEKWRVFRDETELPTGSNLSGGIRSALEDSVYLIVICSAATKESRWCMEEIDGFKKLHNGSNSNIITVLAEGDPSDVFPPSLCFSDAYAYCYNGDMFAGEPDVFEINGDTLTGRRTLYAHDSDSGALDSVMLAHKVSDGVLYTVFAYGNRTVNRCVGI